MKKRKKRRGRSEGKEERVEESGMDKLNSWYINIILKGNKCKEAAAKQLIYRFKVKKQNNN